jgi:hypothetical protein
LILNTDIDLWFHGVWCPDSGYFFVDNLLFEPENEVQEKFVNNMELPGKLYGTVVSFLYCE